MVDISIADWREFFPFPTVRPEQETAINFALNSFLREGKKFCLLEAGTGVGKSAIGVTVARYLAAHGGRTVAHDGKETTGAYLLTTQKILQEQYMNDFGPPPGRDVMLSLKSATNFPCKYYKDQSCAASRRLLKQMEAKLEGTPFYQCCRSSCTYMIAKRNFIAAPLGITNFAYFLAETKYGKQLKPRGLLIIDECHTLEDQLSKNIEITFSERFARTTLKCVVPTKLATTEEVLAWIGGVYKSALRKHMEKIEEQLEIQLEKLAPDQVATLSKEYELLDKHMCKINRFIDAYSTDNWVMNPVKELKKTNASRKFEFKPIDVAVFADDHLYQFGSRVLLMSATIVDKNTFCKSVGLDLSQVAFIRLPSPFPVENRPVHYLGVGSMSLKHINKTLPKLTATIKDLLELHAQEKGIIHAVSYKVAQYVVDQLKSPRLLLHTADNREETIKKHMCSKEPTVLISPSMTEGISLDDDTSRFQILCKVPYPYLGDQVILRRMKRNSSWYSFMTAKTIIQSLGRSIRSENDYATSYILDSDWERFYAQNKGMFPVEFSLALT